MKTTKPLEQVVSAIIDYRGKTPPKTDTGVRLVTAKVIKDGRILEDREEFIAESFYDVWMRRGLPEPGDTLLTTEAPLGQVAQVPCTEKIALAQRVILLRPDPRYATKRYFFYYAQTREFQGRLLARATGTTVFGIKQRELRKVNVSLPELDKQERIVDLISSYDDLIHNNRRRIALLEEAAQQLYKEWFVRLRFPGHERTKILDGVPVGWERGVVGHLFSSLEDGDWIESKDQGGSDYRLLQISNIGVNSFVETNNYRFITEETFRSLRCREVKPGDILISRMPKPIGRAWLVADMPCKMVTAVDVAIGKPDSHRTSTAFVIEYLNCPVHFENCEVRASGTTRPRITRKNLAGIPLLIPCKHVQDRYATLVDPMLEMIRKLQLQNGTVAEARDMLLPRLMSGEIEV